jgi:hypothetical protein
VSDFRHFYGERDWLGSDPGVMDLTNAHPDELNPVVGKVVASSASTDHRSAAPVLFSLIIYKNYSPTELLHICSRWASPRLPNVVQETVEELSKA